MATFMVERSLKGIALSDLAAAQQSAVSTTRRMSDEGTPVRYIRSTFVPESGACFGMFEAGDAATVERANQRANLPYDHVVEALDPSPN